MFDPFFQAAAWLIDTFYAWVGEYSIAIAMVSIAIMVLIAPLTLKSTKGMLEMQRLQPEMKRLQMLQRLDEPESFISTTEGTAKRALAHRPEFMQEKRMSAADVGTAVHAVMQHIPLDKKMSVPEIQEFIEELVGKEILSEDEGKAVRASSISKFYSNELYSRLSKAKNIKREVPFTYAKKDQDGDHQIIQGIIDCLFEEEGGWVLLDYKTDNVQGIADIGQEMASRYGVQLAVYQEAAEAILQIRIQERLLYLFAADRTEKI